MRVAKPRGGFSDRRGTLVEIVNTGRWGQVGVTRSRRGSSWGGHYHKLTTEVFYIVSGKVRFETRRMPRGRVVRRTVGPGHAVTIEPMTLHTLTALEPTVWVAVLSRAFRPNATDFYKP